MPEIPGSRNALARGATTATASGTWDLAVSIFRVRADGARVLYASLHIRGVRADPAARLGPDIRPFHQEPRRLVAHRVDCLAPLPAARRGKVRAFRAPPALPAVTRDGAVPPLRAIVGAVEPLAMARGIRPSTWSLSARNGSVLSLAASPYAPLPIISDRTTASGTFCPCL